MAGIATVAAANDFIRDVYIPAHNARFAVKAEQEGSVHPAKPRDVLVVQDQVPEYRRPFFERLHSVLEADSIRLTVAVGSEPRNSPAGLHALPFVRNVSGRDVSIAGYRLGLKRLSELHLKPELVIVEQALRHLETYALLLRQRRGAKVALWGHGVRVVKPAAALDRLLERR